jgi:hypothetical protein
VSQLISDFNALITTQAEWRTAYAKVDTDMTSLLGPENAAPDQPVGTSGSSVQLDPALRAKLVEFRSHLSEFEKAAGGASPSTAAGSTAAAGDTAAGATPPSVATGSTSNPATPPNPNPANPNPANPSNPASPYPANPSNPATPSDPTTSPAPTGTSGVSHSSPTANMSPSDRARAESEVSASGNADAQKELDAISEILNRSKSGALTKAQTTELKKHVEALRALLAK